MKVVGKKRPRIDTEIPLQAEISQPVQKIFTVLVCAEDGCPFDAPPHDMMQSPGRIESWLSRHIGTLHPFVPFVKKLFQNQRPLGFYLAILFNNGFVH
jgi:hypothetical protein